MAEPQPLLNYTGHLPECPTWSAEEHALYWVGRLSSRELSVALSQRAGRVQPLQEKRKESEEHIKGRIPKEDVSRIRHRIRINRR